MLPKMNLGRKDHTSAVHNGKLYIIGGQDTTSGRPLNDIAVFDINQNKWDDTNIADLPQNLQ